MIRAFIQARMSSARFPGKVLAPLQGRPVIAHVIARVTEVMPVERITVATSTDASDDRLARYVRDLGVGLYRGPLHNVFRRLQLCLEANPCDWFVRVCADSPLLDPALLRVMLTRARRTDAALITNIFPRTFPRGRSLELLHAQTFAGIHAQHLSADEQEHVTTYYYRRPADFTIVNIASEDALAAPPDLAVDTKEDLERLEQVLCELAMQVRGGIHA